jgi:hypothetical protein
MIGGYTDKIDAFINYVRIMFDEDCAGYELAVEELDRLSVKTPNELFARHLHGRDETT